MIDEDEVSKIQYLLHLLPLTSEGTAVSDISVSSYWGHQTSSCPESMCNRQQVSLFDWLTDWLTNSQTISLSDRWTDCLIVTDMRLSWLFLTVCLTTCLTDGLTDWLSVCLTGNMTDWLCDWQTVMLNDYWLLSKRSKVSLRKKLTSISNLLNTKQ